MDWYHKDHDQWCLAIEDDASRYVFDTIETNSRSAARSVDLLETHRHKVEGDAPIMEVIADHSPSSSTPIATSDPCSPPHSSGTCTTMGSSKPCVNWSEPSQTGRSSDSTRPTRNSDGGSGVLRNSSNTTTRSGLTRLFDMSRLRYQQRYSIGCRQQPRMLLNSRSLMEVNMGRNTNRISHSRNLMGLGFTYGHNYVKYSAVR